MCVSCEAVDEFFTGENDVYISLEQNYFLSVRGIISKENKFYFIGYQNTFFLILILNILFQRSLVMLLMF